MLRARLLHTRELKISRHDPRYLLVTADRLALVRKAGNIDYWVKRLPVNKMLHQVPGPERSQRSPLGAEAIENS